MKYGRGDDNYDDVGRRAETSLQPNRTVDSLYLEVIVFGWSKGKLFISKICVANKY